jgi:dihydrofolate synthase/folylpolyglutamate synthase
VERAAAAAAKVDRGLEAGDRVTQFELITAAAFAEFARQEVEVAVVEAGLGGRHDATGVLRAPVVVLTNVGLEHTRWLGPTIGDIAGEKLAVVAPEAVLVLGEADAEVEALAEATGARIVRVGGGGFFETDLPGYQRTNFAVACAAVREHLGRLDTAAAARVAARITVPGRLQVVGDAPVTILDGAHNASGVAALAAALPEREWTGVVSILDDKDAGAMLRALLERCRRIVCTAAPNPRALPPATLASLVEQLGGEAEIVRSPREALQRARELAGPEGAVIVTGSIYLVADLVSAPGARRASAL